LIFKKLLAERGNVMKLLGISGSLRSGSLNTRLLYAAAKSLPERVSFRFISCSELPLYNKDLDLEVKPPAVQQFLDSISTSDCLLIASPEYNYSIPGVLKNALDWASRPAYRSVLAGKPAAIVSASGSAVGGARMQVHLRDVLSATLTPVIQAPPFLVPQAQEMFDTDGTLIDEGTGRRLEKYMQDFVTWVGSL
jgi:chromate reductase